MSCFSLSTGAHLILAKDAQGVTSILHDLIEHKVTALISTVYILQRIHEHCEDVESEKGWSLLKSLELVAFGGSTISDELGSKYLQKDINIVSLYGTTETGVMALGDASKKIKDYKLMIPSKSLRYSLKEMDDNTFELFIKKEDKSKVKSISSAQDGSYSPGDAIKLMPNSEDNSFYILGRIDDTIVHVSGEKTNPLPMEGEIQQNKYVDTCVIVGQQRLFNCVFIKLNSGGLQESLVYVLKSIHNSIKSVNKKCPQHSRILMDLIYILPYETEKDIPTTVKGNVSRKKMEAVFREEIETLYKDMDTEKDGTNLVSNKPVSKELLGYLFKEITKKDINNNDNFFSKGMDSLSAVEFKNKINNSISNKKLKISDIYENNTINKLIDQIYQNGQLSHSQTKSSEYYQESINNILAKHTTEDESWGTKTEVKKPLRKKEIKVLVTGSNGSLGSFIVEELSKDKDVQKIYALVRANNTQEAHNKIQDSFKKRKIVYDTEKVVPVAYSNNSRLGLENMYDELLDVDRIYHVAWRMDFLKGVEDFIDNIKSTLELLKLSAFSKNTISFNFVSTVGAAMPFVDVNEHEVPEKNLSFVVKNNIYCNGYNLSKMISEEMCIQWKNKFLFPLNIFRVGQISGDSNNGIWNTAEHVSTLIKSGQTMKILPKKAFRNGLSWIPVNTAAKGIVEISEKTTMNNSDVMVSHIVNPHHYSWNVVLDFLKSLPGWDFKVVENETYINELKYNSKFQDAKYNPVASLTDFFENLLTSTNEPPDLSTVETKQRSNAVRNCEPVDNNLLNKYIKYWKEIEFIR